MSKSKKRLVVRAFIACLGLGFVGLWLYLQPPLHTVAALYPYPPSWDTVDLGDTPQTVAQKCPGIDQSLADIKADFAFFDHPMGTWIFEVHHDHDHARVTETVFLLRLGSKTHFRERLYKRTSPGS